MNDPYERHTSVITPELFLRAVNILVTKPHVINKRLWGSTILGRYNCRICEKVPDPSTLPVKLQDPGSIDLFVSKLITYLEIELIQRNTQNPEIEILVIELLPKNFAEKHAFQLVLLQKKESTATFYDVTPVEYNQNLCPNFTYKFYLRDDSVGLVADTDISSEAYKWLNTTVLPQVNKWSHEGKQSTQKTVDTSLALVSPDQYYVKYNNLKEKYGKELVKIWPESTDPSKFVYEDVAIASYLLLLWEEKSEENDTVTKQSFVDLGCGNGLLVYILTMEGHSGYGIDVRKRKIWNMYPGNILLLEKTITPSNIDTFTEADWIIGNHSDELTPWIPVIAAKSSYKCKFFLLPCCPYNFNGTKYQRQNASKSQYTDYLEYIHKLSEDCGFQTYTDRLKIPSTKRICFVGKKRKHQEEEYSEICKNIEVLVKEATSKNLEYKDTTSEFKNFKAREATEKVRNCTKVDKKIVESIVKCAANYMLEGYKQNSEWSPGRTVNISEIVSLLPSDTLKVLKSECGGLQTLLKNHHHTFEVKDGKIRLQYPKTIDELNTIRKNNKRFKTNINLKVKECWFHKNHPQGCPLKDDECSFKHSKPDSEDTHNSK